MNVCCFQGRLSTDIELKEYGETKVAMFNIAIRAERKEKDTDFFRFTAFGRVAEMLHEYCAKGDRIAVQTRAYKPKPYENSKGHKIYPSVEFIIDKFDLIETRSDREAPKTKKEWKEKQKEEDFMSVPESISEELPFE